MKKTTNVNTPQNFIVTHFVHASIQTQNYKFPVNNTMNYVKFTKIDSKININHVVKLLIELLKVIATTDDQED